MSATHTRAMQKLGQLYQGNGTCALHKISAASIRSCCIDYWLSVSPQALELRPVRGKDVSHPHTHTHTHTQRGHGSLTPHQNRSRTPELPINASLAHRQTLFTPLCCCLQHFGRVTCTPPSRLHRVFHLQKAWDGRGIARDGGRGQHHCQHKECWKKARTTTNPRDMASAPVHAPDPALRHERTGIKRLKPQRTTIEGREQTPHHTKAMQKLGKLYQENGTCTLH